MPNFTTEPSNLPQSNLNQLMAAIDLGSNSFHLAIARLDHGEVRKLASMSEKVQLAAGLDEHNYLSQEAQQRGLACLNRFVGRLKAVSASHLRVVATNTLRQAKNANEFIQKANAILPKPIEIIAGREEARLIYLGVSHTNAFTDKRLVIDIGGGSTEFIIGQGFQPSLTESLQMGCVSFSQKFFANGEISEKAFQKAIDLASQKMSQLVTKPYQQEGWHDVMGSSGTIKAIGQILVALGLTDTQANIHYQGLKEIKNKLIKCKHIHKIDFPDLKEHRKAVLPAGVAILLAIMKELHIEHLSYSDGALREGVMYDMLGRFANEDVRDRSVQALMIRYSVDEKQAKRVTKTAKLLFEQVKNRLGLHTEDGDLLRRTAYLHEIGLAISHSGYHRHTAYLLENSDIDGFSQVDKKRMACLAYHHRRKLKAEGFEEAKMLGNMNLVYLCLLLRLAVKIHHGRSKIDDLHIQLILESDKLWLLNLLAENKANHALLLSDLQAEIPMFQKWGIQLTINQISANHKYRLSI